MEQNKYNLDLPNLRSTIERRLSPKRYQHSLGVAASAVRLADLHGENVEAAEIAGLLHDYAKNIDAPALLQWAEKIGLPLRQEDRLLPDLLHGPVGAHLVREELGMNDPKILSAIAAHTMGGMNMSKLDKIIFLADMIEPGRDYPLLERLTCLAERDLEQAMIYGLDLTINYCLEQHRLLHPQTIAVRNQFLILFPNAVIC